RLVDVEAQLRAEARARGRAGERGHFLGIRVGVTHAPRPIAVGAERLGQRDGELLTLALVGVLEQEDVAEVGVATEARAVGRNTARCGRVAEWPGAVRVPVQGA